jgi:hypothetical protein
MGQFSQIGERLQRNQLALAQHQAREAGESSAEHFQTLSKGM